jgi:hypothetical protein
MTLGLGRLIFLNFPDGLPDLARGELFMAGMMVVAVGAFIVGIPQ